MFSAHRQPRPPVAREADVFDEFDGEPQDAQKLLDTGILHERVAYHADVAVDILHVGLRSAAWQPTPGRASEASKDAFKISAAYFIIAAIVHVVYWVYEQGLVGDAIRGICSGLKYIRSGIVTGLGYIGLGISSVVSLISFPFLIAFNGIRSFFRYDQPSVGIHGASHSKSSLARNDSPKVWEHEGVLKQQPMTTFDSNAAAEMSDAALKSRQPSAPLSTDVKNTAPSAPMLFSPIVVDPYQGASAPPALTLASNDSNDVEDPAPGVDVSKLFDNRGRDKTLGCN